MPKSRRGVPLGPLLASFRHLPRDRGPSGGRTRDRDAALRSARSEWLNESFLERSSADEFGERVAAFYQAVVPVPWHGERMARRGGMVRHGLDHLLRSQDPFAVRLARCATPGGPYHVTGLGPSFWAAVAKALDPDRHPLWSPAVAAGLARVGRVGPDAGRDVGASWSAAARAYEAVLADRPDLTASDLDAFFVAVAGMRGRELGLLTSPADRLPDEVARALREVRSRTPLKKRSAEHTAALANAREEFEAARAAGDAARAARAAGVAVEKALHNRLPELAEKLRAVRAPDDLPAALADDFLGETGVALAAAILHLRQPNRFPAWTESARRGLAALDDADDPALPRSTGICCSATWRTASASGSASTRAKSSRCWKRSAMSQAPTAPRTVFDPGLAASAATPSASWQSLPGTTGRAGWPPSGIATGSPSASRWSSCARR